MRLNILFCFVLFCFVLFYIKLNEEYKYILYYIIATYYNGNIISKGENERI